MSGFLCVPDKLKRTQACRKYEYEPESPKLSNSQAKTLHNKFESFWAEGVSLLPAPYNYQHGTERQKCDQI